MEYTLATVEIPIYNSGCYNHLYITNHGFVRCKNMPSSHH